jgi:hypothetical protein
VRCVAAGRACVLLICVTVTGLLLLVAVLLLLQAAL